jgi:tetratricopeptide (TPR) repeat protein
VELRAKRLRTITPPPPFLGWAREAASLEGVDPELALAFWRVLRRVRAWAETPPEERMVLFGAGKREAWERLGAACGHAPGLVEALGTFALLIRAPGEVDARRLSGACSQVHAWAEERSLPSVAMLFAEAAAYADPDDPTRANDAGRMCRRAAEDERASSWYHRGYGLGVRRNDPTETIRAQIGYGNLMKDLGQHEEARKFLERAARRAINTGRRRQAGEAHHDLLLMSAETEDFFAALRHTRLSLNYYPLNHPRIPYLVHDFAFLLIRLGDFASALSQLGKLKSLLQKPEEQMLLFSSIAWAAGGCGERDVFDDAEQRALQHIKSHAEFAPATLIHVAEGARYFREFDRAATYAGLGREAAHRRKEEALEREAGELLAKIATQDAQAGEESASVYPEIERLIRRIDVRLRKWKAPGRQQPRARS